MSPPPMTFPEMLQWARERERQEELERGRSALEFFRRVQREGRRVGPNRYELPGLREEMRARGLTPGTRLETPEESLTITEGESVPPPEEVARELLLGGWGLIQGGSGALAEHSEEVAEGSRERADELHERFEDHRRWLRAHRDTIDELGLGDLVDAWEAIAHFLTVSGVFLTGVGVGLYRFAVGILPGLLFLLELLFNLMQFYVVQAEELLEEWGAIDRVPPGHRRLMEERREWLTQMVLGMERALYDVRREWRRATPERRAMMLGDFIGQFLPSLLTARGGSGRGALPAAAIEGADALEAVRLGTGARGGSAAATAPAMSMPSAAEVGAYLSRATERLGGLLPRPDAALAGGALMMSQLPEETPGPAPSAGAGQAPARRAPAERGLGDRLGAGSAPEAPPRISRPLRRALQSRLRSIQVAAAEETRRLRRSGGSAARRRRLQGLTRLLNDLPRMLRTLRLRPESVEALLQLDLDDWLELYRRLYAARRAHRGPRGGASAPAEPAPLPSSGAARWPRARRRFDPIPEPDARGAAGRAVRQRRSGVVSNPAGGVVEVVGRRTIDPVARRWAHAQAEALGLEPARVQRGHLLTLEDEMLSGAGDLGVYAAQRGDELVLLVVPEAKAGRMGAAARVALNDQLERLVTRLRERTVVFVTEDGERLIFPPGHTRHGSHTLLVTHGVRDAAAPALEPAFLAENFGSHVHNRIPLGWQEVRDVASRFTSALPTRQAPVELPPALTERVAPAAGDAARAAEAAEAARIRRMLEEQERSDLIDWSALVD